MPIVLQKPVSGARKKRRKDGAGERESSAFKQVTLRSGKQMSTSFSVEKCKITKGCGLTLGCNCVMQTIRMRISLTLCLTLSHTSQRAQCATVTATSAVVSRLAAAGVRPSRLTAAREGYDHNARQTQRGRSSTVPQLTPAKCVNLRERACV